MVSRVNSWNTRMDYQIGARDSINGRFTLTRNFTDDISTSNATSPSIGSSLTYRDYSTVVTWTHSFGGNLINQMRVQYSPNNSAVTAPPEPARTSTLITGLAGFGRAFGAPYIVSQDRYQFEDNLTWLPGRPHIQVRQVVSPGPVQLERFGLQENTNSNQRPLSVTSAIPTG